MRGALLALALLLLSAPAAAQIHLPPASSRFALTSADARHQADLASNWVLYGSLGVETLRTFTGDHKKRDGLREVCTFAGGQGAALLSKALFSRDRPDHSNDHSYFSGHAASAPRWYFAIPVAALRLEAGKHDLFDVITGGLVGAGARYGCERWIR